MVKFWSHSLISVKVYEFLHGWVLLYLRVWALLLSIQIDTFSPKFTPQLTPEKYRKITVNHMRIPSSFKFTPTLKIHPKWAILSNKIRGLFPVLLTTKNISILSNYSGVIYEQLRNLQHRLIPYYSGSNLVFSTIKLYTKKTTKIWFLIIT